jgi:hypothetical protein
MLSPFKANLFIVNLSAVILFAALCLPLSAQEAEDRIASSLYPVDIRVEKVYAYRSGYVVTYKKGAENINAYIPNEWFRKPDDPNGFAKAQKLLLGSGPELPHMVVYYQDGQFVRVRLFVRKEVNHETWGYIPLNVNLDQYFENLETLDIQFK